MYGELFSTLTKNHKTISYCNTNFTTYLIVALAYKLLQLKKVNKSSKKSVFRKSKEQHYQEWRASHLSDECVAQEKI